MKTLVLLFFLTTMILLASGSKLYAMITDSDTTEVLVPAPPGLIPDQVIVQSPGGSWGSGYIVQKSLFEVELIAVDHVATAGMFVYHQTGGLPVGEPIIWSDLICDWSKADSTCQASTLLESANIIRDVSRIPDEFVIWDKDNQMWLPFRFDPNSRCAKGTFCIAGLPVDLNKDGIVEPNEFAKVRQGMSGSPVIEAESGVPLVNNEGKFVSRGELQAMIGNQHESVLGVVLNGK